MSAYVSLHCTCLGYTSLTNLGLPAAETTHHHSVDVKSLTILLSFGLICFCFSCSE